MQKQSYWEKQRQKAMQKLADPAWREEQRAKRLQQAQRQQQRAREKAASPEYRQKRIEKAKQYDQRRKEKAVSAPSKKTRTSRGLKGRSLTADERRIQTAIGTLPCIACHIHGQHSPVVSLHHIFGRTAENAHKYVLPLCKWHHQYAAPAEVREQYP